MKPHRQSSTGNIKDIPLYTQVILLHLTHITSQVEKIRVEP